MANLVDSDSKLAWARQQLPRLRIELRSFFDSHPCEFFNELSPDKSQTFVKLKLTHSIPKDIAHLVGDIIHNLRASLDYSACDLAEANGAADVSNVYFPFGKTKESFEASAKEKLRKLSKEAREHIRALNPYRGGNEALWLIHYLDLGDKHRRLTPIGMSGSTGAKIDHLTSGSIKFASPKWESLAKGMRVATIATGSQWTGEISANTTVAFGEIESIAFIPVEPLMDRLVFECETTLAGIREKFFAAPAKNGSSGFRVGSW
jgi:hypothetical protein